MGFGKAIPRAHVLADVTAKHPILHLPGKFLGYRFFELNGEVANAAATIHHVGFRDGIGGAGIHAAGTSTAIVGGGTIGLQLQIDDELGQEEKAATLAVEQEAVFTNLAIARPLRPRALQYGCRIYKGAPFNGSNLGFQLAKQFAQFTLQYMMVILAVSILSQVVIILRG